ncbi:MAG: M14 family metallocarboxypeptidase [Verrucomicrobiales bacterium]|nr:M14 family metallocarboxypeptidase [Verrucomicrobiales bacterium]
MKRLGKNRGGYHGETIAIEHVLRDTLALAHARGWSIENLGTGNGRELPVLRRRPRESRGWSPRIYVSTGIHGDEPAGPLAARRLVETDPFPPHAYVWLCPCLNPSGFPRNTRESAEGIDLNRDYRHLQSPEIQSHVAWLQKQPMFDVALCLHEDWEAAGFYVYELNPAGHASLAPTMIEAVRDVCPIDLSPEIDGRTADRGIICPNIDPASRPEWPEALYLIQHKTRLSYTLESPSDYELTVRVTALEVGVRAAVTNLRMEPTPGVHCNNPNPPP